MAHIEGITAFNGYMSTQGGRTGVESALGISSSVLPFEFLVDLITQLRDTSVFLPYYILCADNLINPNSAEVDKEHSWK